MDELNYKSVILHEKTLKKLESRCRALLDQFQSPSGEQIYQDFQAWSPPKNSTDHRAGFVWESRTEAVSSLERMTSVLSCQSDQKLWTDGNGGIYRSQGVDPECQKLVSLFPGQGALYTHMEEELCRQFSIFGQGLSQMDEILSGSGMMKLSDLLFPQSKGTPKKIALGRASVQQTQYSQPAIGVFCAGLYRVMESLGFSPAMAGGMSFGEVPALWAGGIFSDRTFFEVIHIRGGAMAIEPRELAGQGAMMSVSGDNIDQIGKWVNPIPDVVVEAWNSPLQLVLSGRKNRLEKLQFTLQEKGFDAFMLPVSGAFHSPFMEKAKAVFASAITEIGFGHPRIPVYSNLNCSVYPDSPWMMRQVLTDHIRQPVCFRHMIERIYADGGFAFVEFSPKKILTRFIQDILKAKPHILVPLNDGNRRDTRYQLQRPAIVQAIFNGHPPIVCRSHSVSENGIRLFGLPRTLKIQHGHASLIFEGMGNNRVVPADLIWRQACHGGMKINDSAWQEQIFPTLVSTHPLASVAGPDPPWQRRFREAAVHLMVHGYIDRPLDWLMAGHGHAPSFDFKRTDSPILTRA